MSENKFNKDMTIGDAMAIHPRVREVFAGYHLGGCAHCVINEFETIEQVTGGYGVPLEPFLETLESLVEEDGK